MVDICLVLILILLLSAFLWYPRGYHKILSRGENYPFSHTESCEKKGKESWKWLIFGLCVFFRMQIKCKPHLAQELNMSRRGELKVPASSVVEWLWLQLSGQSARFLPAFALVSRISGSSSCPKVWPSVACFLNCFPWCFHALVLQ